MIIKLKKCKNSHFNSIFMVSNLWLLWHTKKVGIPHKIKFSCFGSTFFYFQKIEGMAHKKPLIQDFKKTHKSLKALKN